MRKTTAITFHIRKLKLNFYFGTKHGKSKGIPWFGQNLSLKRHS